jgi:hypothetical protein
MFFSSDGALGFCPLEEAGFFSAEPPDEQPGSIADSIIMDAIRAIIGLIFNSIITPCTN